jgi:hypothetical protein
MTVTFRPAIRAHTPLIIGIAGPTKAGKTYSALRIARGLAGDKPVAMINAEGPRGHQYAEKFTYLAYDLTAPYRPDRYIEALQAARELKPGCVIVDSVSHCHDGPGGILEWHEEILDQIAAKDYDKRQRATFAAWVKPKASENKLIYTLLEMQCPVVLAMRAKEKIKIVKGKDPIDLGWQPIVGERIAFETMFTLMLPPHSKGVPNLALSEMREPFDTMIPSDKPIDEHLGRELAKWAAGGMPKESTPQSASEPQAEMPTDEPDYLYDDEAWTQQVDAMEEHSQQFNQAKIKLKVSLVRNLKGEERAHFVNTFQYIQKGKAKR